MLNGETEVLEGYRRELLDEIANTYAKVAGYRLELYRINENIKQVEDYLEECDDKRVFMVNNECISLSEIYALEKMFNSDTDEIFLDLIAKTHIVEEEISKISFADDMKRQLDDYKSFKDTEIKYKRYDVVIDAYKSGTEMFVYLMRAKPISHEQPLQIDETYVKIQDDGELRAGRDYLELNDYMTI